MVDAVASFEAPGATISHPARGQKSFRADRPDWCLEMSDNGLRKCRTLRTFPRRPRSRHRRTAAFAGMEGTPPLLVEIQAWSRRPPLGTPRRSVVGWIRAASPWCSRCSGAWRPQARAARMSISTWPAACGFRSPPPSAAAAALISSLTGAALPAGTVLIPRGPGGQRCTGERGNQRGSGGEVGGRLGDAQAAGDVEVDVVLPSRGRHGPPAPPAPWRAGSGSQPTTARRGVPSEDGATSAWISTSSGRVPSIPAKTAVSGGGEVAAGQKQLRGVGRLRAGPASDISKTPISSVGPKRFLTARMMRKWWPCRPRTTPPRRPYAPPPGGRRSGRPW